MSKSVERKQDLSKASQAQPKGSSTDSLCYHRIGQKYDERRGVGNGPQICLNCELTLDEIIDNHAHAYLTAKLSELLEKKEELKSPIFDERIHTAVPVVRASEIEKMLEDLR